MERNGKRDWNQALKEAVRYGWGNCGAQPDELLTDEHRRKIVQFMGEKLRAYIANYVCNRQAHQ